MLEHIHTNSTGDCSIKKGYYIDEGLPTRDEGGRNHPQVDGGVYGRKGPRYHLERVEGQSPPVTPGLRRVVAASHLQRKRIFMSICLSPPPQGSKGVNIDLKQCVCSAEGLCLRDVQN